ncbi:MAG TPA: hypothetical protein PLV68_07585, partial [Ilumatobacteraceae bacterium]|nr:hypothetical protein [Ilumatobacteraceae bacterium]
MTWRGKSVGRKLPSLSMTVRFGLISLALFALVGLWLGGQLQGTLRDRAHGEATANAQVLADVGLRPLLRQGAAPTELQVDPTASEQLDRALGSMMWSNGL